MASLRLSVQICGPIHLENIFYPTRLNVAIYLFRQINKDNLYSTVIRPVMARRHYVDGQYRLYNDYGQYKWRFLLPNLMYLCLHTLLRLSSALFSVCGYHESVLYSWKDSTKSWCASENGVFDGQQHGSQIFFH